MCYESVRVRVYCMSIASPQRRDACIARCSGTLNNTATFDNKRVSVSALVCYVQPDTYTLEKTRQSAVCGLQRSIVFLDSFFLSLEYV